MKSRLFVVDKDSIKTTLENMEVSVIVPEPNGKLWKKTLLDIVSDLMQVELGDYIFLWESGYERIYGVYRAISKPFYSYEEGRNDIFRIKIDIAYSFEKPIMEYDVINNPYMKNKLWNIIGKKVAGKSRGTSPITPEEMQFLIQSLIDVNKSYSYSKDYSVVSVDNELKFDFEAIENSEIPSRISEYAYAPIQFKNNKEVQYEKALEGVLNYLFREKQTEIISELDIECENVIWYANYLPYGLERSEIDYMIMESVDGTNINQIDVIELMSGVIDDDHIRRCLQYSKWVSESITNAKNIVRPILICGSKSKTSKNGFNNENIKQSLSERPKEYGFDNIEIYTYSLENIINFNKHEEDSNE